MNTTTFSHTHARFISIGFLLAAFLLLPVGQVAAQNGSTFTEAELAVQDGVRSALAEESLPARSASPAFASQLSQQQNTFERRTSDDIERRFDDLRRLMEERDEALEEDLVAEFQRVIFALQDQMDQRERNLRRMMEARLSNCAYAQAAPETGAGAPADSLDNRQ